MAYANGELYVATPTGSSRIATSPARRNSTSGRVMSPISGYNHHWTKAMVAPDGNSFVGIGSNSNAGENGLEMEKGRAAVWMVDARSGAYRMFASGIRNPVGIAWNPWSHYLWVAVNERDELGDNLVPDFLTSVKDGAFYGWPWSYYGQTVDTRVKPPRPEMVAKAIKPDYALGSHLAPLGLAFRPANLGARPARGVRRRAWLVEPQRSQRLSGGIRASQATSRPAVQSDPDRIPGWRHRLWPSGQRHDCQRWQPGCCRRRRRQGGG
jgi:glucose/arabinose dehydrogenase